MKYYQVRLDVDVTGVKDGINQVEIDQKSMRENGVYEEFIDFFKYANKGFWIQQDKIWSFKVPAIKARLLKRANVTDIMGYTPSIFPLINIYSQKFVDITTSSAFNTGPNALFQVDIENVPEKYYMMFFETIVLEELNYEDSILRTGYELTNDLRHYHVKSYAEFRELQKSVPLVKFNRMAIPKSFFGKDIICIQGAVAPFYSERLIDFLTDCGITGMLVQYQSSIELVFVEA